MKYLSATLAAAALCSTPVWAASQTIEFTSDDGSSQTWVLSDDGTASSGDVSVSYTWDAEALVLCANMPEGGELCLTFEETGAAVGDMSKYTATDGSSGTAKILDITE